MDAKKWMDDMVYQRMELLLDEFYRSEEKGKTVEEIIDRSSRETSYLYFCGLKDGIRIMKFIDSL